MAESSWSAANTPLSPVGHWLNTKNFLLSRSQGEGDTLSPCFVSKVPVKLPLFFHLAWLSPFTLATALLWSYLFLQAEPFCPSDQKYFMNFL